MATCPAGHDSTTDDYCDTCGVPLAATPTVPPPGSDEPATTSPEASVVTCPACGEPVPDRFCESCRYDIESGQGPAPAGVTLTLGADRRHWNRMVGPSGEPAFPAVPPTFTFELTGDRATLGRVRPGAQADVDLALTGATADPAVSHYHCTFERQSNGTWIVRDTGSANGTWINDASQPLAADEEHTLAEGDRILVGAWTCLTVHLAAPPSPQP